MKAVSRGMSAGTLVIELRLRARYDRLMSMRSVVIQTVRLMALALVGGALGSIVVGANDLTVPFPEGYRQWTFLHSSMVPSTFASFGKRPCEKPCTSGIFYFYANSKAMQGLRTGSYEDGSVIAEEMLEFLADEKGGGKEGQRRVVGVMVKDSKRYEATGGWGYGNFEDPSKTDVLDEKAKMACYTCHIAKKDKGYVFTEYRDR
jgi:hypothetical protein